MPVRQRNQLSAMEDQLSGDPLLSTVADLFAMRAEQHALVERPQPRPRRRAIIATPAFFGVGALLSLAVCILLGGIYHNGFLALCGLIGPVLLGAGYLARLGSSQPRIFRAPGMRARPIGNSTS